MKKITIQIILLSLMIALGISACSLSLAQDITPPPGYQAPVYEEPELLWGAFPLQEPDPENGASVYQEKCLPCHGDTGLGDGPESTGLPVEVARIGDADVADLAAPLEWYTIILQGNIDRFMPPFSASLNEQDVWDVISYVYSFRYDEVVVAEGAALFTENCADCHGTMGTGPVAPGAFDFRDSEQLVAFSLDDFVQKIATGNGNQDHVFSTVLDADQQKTVAIYLRSMVLPMFEQPAETAASEPEAVPTEDSASDEPPGEDTAPAEDTEVETEENPDTGLGQVTGVVINGSGGDLPNGLEVTLEVYQSFDVILTETVSANEDGSFRFEDVVLDPELIYITMVDLNGTFFPSAFHMGSETLGDSIDLPITIYDMTSDLDGLSVSRLHVFFQFINEETIQVIHQVSISNFGNLMVAPEQENEPILEFALPEGAANLIFQSGSLGNPYVKTTTGFSDPSPVLPGSNSYEVLFAYELPYLGKLDWVLPVDLPTDVAVLFVQGEEVKVESEILLASGTEALDQEIYQVFVANDLSNGQEMELNISSGFSGIGNLNLDSNILTIILGVVGLGLAGFGAWRFFRQSDDYYDDEIDQDYTVDGLMDEIIELDQAFVSGDLDEASYQIRRDSLKAELKELLDQKEAD